jgi:hypothetical protein
MAKMVEVFREVRRVLRDDGTTAIYGTLHDYPIQVGAFYGILQDEDMNFNPNEQATGQDLGSYHSIGEAIEVCQRHHDSLHPP